MRVMEQTESLTTPHVGILNITTTAQVVSVSHVSVQIHSCDQKNKYYHFTS